MNRSLIALAALALALSFGMARADEFPSLESLFVAAQAGDAKAQYTLAMKLLLGEGVAKDRQSGEYWLKAASDQHLGEASDRYWAYIYYGDDGLQGTLRDAFMRQVAKAQRGDNEARYQVGIALLAGDPVRKNEHQALDWLGLAAERGHPSSQVALAGALEEGTGTDKDLAEAINWLTRAARQGEFVAMYRLARHYQDGLGVGVDPVLAYAWMRASERSRIHAIPLVARKSADAQFAMLAPDQKLEGDGLATSWHPGAAISRASANTPMLAGEWEFDAHSEMALDATKPGATISGGNRVMRCLAETDRADIAMLTFVLPERCTIAGKVTDGKVLDWQAACGWSKHLRVSGRSVLEPEASHGTFTMFLDDGKEIPGQLDARRIGVCDPQAVVATP